MPKDQEPILKIDDVWPPRTGHWTAARLRLLPDDVFRELLRRVGRLTQKRQGRATRAQKFVSNKIARERKRVLTRMRKQRNIATPNPLTMLPRHYRPSDLLDSLCPDRPKIWRETAKKRIKGGKIEARDFSFLDNPAASLDLLGKIIHSDATSYDVALDFMDKYCLDVAPLLVFGLMTRDMTTSLKGGNITQGLGKVVRAVGLSRFLRMDMPDDRQDTSDIWPLVLKERDLGKKPEHSHRSLHPTTKQKAADDVVASADDWLRRVCAEGQDTVVLSKEGKGNLSSIITELLENAERHANLKAENGGGWWLAGFMARRQRQDGSDYYLCHLGFVSRGASIGESLKTSEDEESQSEIDRYVRTHKNISRREKGDEMLRTVCALQDRISRLSQAEEARGVGLPRMMDFVAAFGQTEDSSLQPRIAFLSGNTYILVTGNYRVTQPTGDDGARRLWFNPQNAMEQPPDNDHVFTLDKRFPGTVIAVRFALDKDVLRNVAAENEDNGVSK